jgi:magnesium-transporting ATPase (P-type)
MLILNQLWFSFDTMWSPSSLYSDFCLSVYNLVFTLVPPFAYGAWDQDLPQEVLLARPHLYAVVNNPLTIVYLIWILILALWQSAACFYSVRWTMENESLQAAGIVCYVTVVYMVILQILLWSHSHNLITIIAYTVNIIIVPLVCYLYMAVFTTGMKGDLQGSASYLFSWLGMFVAIVAGLLPGFAVQYTRNRFFPSKHRLAGEKVYLYGPDSLTKIKATHQPSEFDVTMQESLRRESAGGVQL